MERGDTKMLETNNRVRLLSIVMTLFTLLVFSFVPMYASTYTENTSVQVRNKVTIPFDTITKGDAVSIFDDVIVEGELHGDAIAIFGDITILGKVAGDVTCVLGKVVLGDNAEVDGDVTAVGGGMERALGARISGSVSNVGLDGVFTKDILRFSWGRGWLRWANLFSYILYLGGLFALALLTISLFPNHVAEVGVRIERELGRSALIGFLAVILIGPMMVLISITIVGIPVAFLLGCAFMVAKMLGYVAFVTLLGLRIIPSEKRNNLGSLALGVLVLGLVRYIPLVGPLVSIVVTIITLGAVLDSRFGTNKPWLPPKQAA
jgi:hypothetical protein